jgi:outer membrane immunogenic protein
MKHTAFSIAAIVALIGTPALAADMAVKAPPPPAPVAAPYSWAGFYIGVNGGYGWSRSGVDPVGTNTFCNPAFSGCTPGDVADFAPIAQIAAIPQGLPIHTPGGIFGGQIGYNFQVGKLIAGVETDLSWTGMKGSTAQAGPTTLIGASPGVFVSSQASASQSLDYFGTLRGRFGWTPVNPLLLYVTGGLAYGHLKSNTSISEAFTCGACVIAPDSGSVSSTLAGWTIGGGLEWMLSRNWTVKAEYLYFDLGSITYALSPLTSTAGGVPWTTVAVSSRVTDLNGSIFRVGVNYRWD